MNEHTRAEHIVKSMANAVEAMDIAPDRLASLPKAEEGTHQHMIIEWEGGVIWLDMVTFPDHHSVDVRQFNPDAEMKGQGVFTIVNGKRAMMDEFLKDTNGTRVQGHQWPGGYVVTLLTDRHGQEAAAVKRSPGNG